LIKINLVVVGKIREPFYKEAINEFSKRLSKFCDLNIIETRELDINNLGLEAVKNGESEAQLKKIKAHENVLLIDLHGEEMDSETFACYLSSLIDKGVSPINFVIAGTYGYGEALVRRADKRISLSKLTFPHQMVRVIFLEQLYRAFKIINGESYHH
jgi:23S rRNA (pseudouridine1915-N3)-methyltransferase